MPRKTRAHRTASSPSESPFQSELFWSEKNKELYETLNIKRKIWAERKFSLDEVDPATWANFERRIACHSLWPISHLYTIPLERCAFLYALITNAPINFAHLVLRSLNEVHRSSSTAHALFHHVFIHRILLFLGLDDFPASEPVHIVASIGATFLRQRATYMRESSKCPRVEPSNTAPPPPSFTCSTSNEAFVDPVAAAVPPPSTSDDFDICCTLEIVMIVQATHGQLLVDMLDELRALQADLVHLRRSSSPPPFDDGF